MKFKHLIETKLTVEWTSDVENLEKQFKKILSKAYKIDMSQVKPQLEKPTAGGKNRVDVSLYFVTQFEADRVMSTMNDLNHIFNINEEIRQLSLDKLFGLKVLDATDPIKSDIPGKGLHTFIFHYDFAKVWPKITFTYCSYFRFYNFR